MADVSFFAQERYLLELYARYAATALDGATALAVATNGHEEARALLDLARALADASTSDQVVRALVDAVPSVVDCDRVSVWVWDEVAGELACRGHSNGGDEPLDLYAMRFRPEDNGLLASLLSNPSSEPLFADREVGRPLRHRDARAVRRRGGDGGADRGPRPLPRHADGDGHLRARPAAAGARAARPRLGRGGAGRHGASDSQARGHGDPPGPSRRADRARQPDRVRGADGARPGRGGRERRAGRAVLRGPGRLQVRERRSRAPRRRRAPLPCCRASARHDPLG